jgi:hypothetical protein
MASRIDILAWHCFGLASDLGWNLDLRGVYCVELVALRYYAWAIGVCYIGWYLGLALACAYRYIGWEGSLLDG